VLGLADNPAGAAPTVDRAILKVAEHACWLARGGAETLRLGKLIDQRCLQAATLPVRKISATGRPTDHYTLGAIVPSWFLGHSCRWADARAVSVRGCGRPGGPSTTSLGRGRSPDARPHRLRMVAIRLAQGGRRTKNGGTHRPLDARDRASVEGTVWRVFRRPDGRDAGEVTVVGSFSMSIRRTVAMTVIAG
jgi:hypothetical protein